MQDTIPLTLHCTQYIGVAVDNHQKHQVHFLLAVVLCLYSSGKVMLKSSVEVFVLA